MALALDKCAKMVFEGQAFEFATDWFNSDIR